MRARRHHRALCLALLSTALAGACGGGAEEPPHDLGRAVMVMDDGIDLTLPVFKDKVLAAYTVECREQLVDGGAGPDGGADADGGAPTDAGAYDSGHDPAQVKAAMLAELARPDDSCHLREGIAAKPNPLADLESKRERWNDLIDEDISVLGNSLLDALEMRLETLSFHGTATAGIIAQDNPRVRLVLVERPLKSAGAVAMQTPCLGQAEIDQVVALFSDAEVRAAYVARPPATLDEDVAAAMAAHGVALVNESFGRITRHGLELLLLEKGCPELELRPFFAALYELDHLREQAQPQAALIVRSAGNEGALLNGPEDSADCRLDDPVRVTVGSYGVDGTRSQFSDFGACVDLYAPGELVVGPLPGDWRFPLSGTSMSAPLVTRLLSLTAALPFQPTGARADLLKVREPNRYLAHDRFPPSLLYEPRSGRALTVTPPPARPLRADPVDLGHVLWPWRALARARALIAPLSRAAGGCARRARPRGPRAAGPWPDP